MPARACACSNTYMSDTWKWDFSPYADSSAPSSDVSISSSASNDDIVASAGTSFDAGKWRIVKVGSSATPPGRYGHVAAVIQSRHQMLVFGGNGGDIDLLDDLWVFGLVSGARACLVVEAHLPRACAMRVVLAQPGLVPTCVS